MQRSASTLPGPSVVTAPHWALHDKLIKNRFSLQAAPGDEQPESVVGGRPLLAVGLLTMEEQAVRRSIARRTMHARYRSLLSRETVVLRYLLPAAAACPHVRTSGEVEPACDMRAENAKRWALAAENATHRDLLRLPTPEGATRCWSKVILWMRHALRAWPGVQFVGVADDDVYLALPRLAADLASLRAAGHSHVYWGQPMWMGYWNESRFEGEGFGGTSAEKDETALAAFLTAHEQNHGRASVDALHSTSPRRGVGVCSTYSKRDEWMGRSIASGPFMFANTDLAIMGSDLAGRLLDSACLSNFAASFDRAQRTRKFVRRGQYPCEPNIDQLLGYLVAHAARNVTYVQAQFHTQGFPWMTYQHNRPTGRAFYVHKLGSEVWSWRYTDALIAREAPYEPMARECTPCFDSWGRSSSWVSGSSPSSLTYSTWTCCATLPRVMVGGDSLDRCQRERSAVGRQVFRHRGQPMPMADGYCAPTDEVEAQRGNRSCGRVHDREAKGYWKLMQPWEQHVPHTLGECVSRCLECAACRYVSFSESHFQRECSWYASCPRLREPEPRAEAKEPLPTAAQNHEFGPSGSKLLRIGSELCPTFSTVRVKRPAGAMAGGSAKGRGHFSE